MHRGVFVENLQLIIKRIQDTIAAKDLSVNKALIESGVGKDLIANMLKGRVPVSNKMSALADYLDVSVDYLLGRTDNPEINK